MAEIKYDIVEKIGVLSENSKGWKTLCKLHAIKPKIKNIK